MSAAVRLLRGVRRYADPLLGLVLAAANLVELGSWGGHVHDRALVGVLSAGSALAVAARRRVPLASVVVCLALQGGAAYLAPAYSNQSYVHIVVFMVNMYSLGAYVRGVEAWAAVLGIPAAILVIARGDGDHTAGGIAFYLAMSGLPWGIGLALRLRTDRLEHLEARSAELRAQAEHAVADERARIARELHDVVSHAIAVTVLQARGGRRMIGRDPTAVRRSLDAIEQTNTAALTDMRRLLTLLREYDPDASSREEPAPSLERLDLLLEQVRDSGLPVEVARTGEPVPLPPGLELSVYRIVQEALTNALKHAGPGARARVGLDYGLDDLAVEITNTGRVAPVRSEGGHGLLGIRERVSVAGGSLQAGPRPGGYAVRARLPYLTDLTPRAESVRSS